MYIKECSARVVVNAFDGSGDCIVNFPTGRRVLKEFAVVGNFINNGARTACLMLLITAAACSNSGNGPSQTSKETSKAETGQSGTTSAEIKKPDPVTLKWSKFMSGRGKDYLENYVKPFVEKKFPHITLEYIEMNSEKELDANIATGNIPDILIAGDTRLPILADKHFPLDLKDLVKVHNFDLKQIEAPAISAAELYSTKGELNGLPFTKSAFGLFYNKDIFDKFGVSYPKDGITWEETIELARKVTRQDGATQYLGLQYSGSHTNIGKGMALNLIDPKTGKAAFNTDQWLKVLNMLHDIYSIPGNQLQNNLIDRFVNGQTAMVPWWTADIINAVQKKVDGGGSLNWDVVTYPKFQGYDGYFEIGAQMYVISKVSKHQEDAFKVITYLATDPEVLSKAATNFDLPVVKMDNLDKLFGSGREILKGKNVQGMLKGKFLNPHAPSQYDDLAKQAFDRNAGKYIPGKYPTQERHWPKQRKKRTRRLLRKNRSNGRNSWRAIFLQLFLCKLWGSNS